MKHFKEASIDALKTYTPVGNKAEAYFSAIESAGFLEEFADLLDSYSDDVDAGVIQDFLDNDGDWVLDTLGLPELTTDSISSDEEHTVFDSIYDMANKLSFKLFHQNTADTSLAHMVENWLSDHGKLPEGEWYEVYLAESDLDEEALLEEMLSDDDFIHDCKRLRKLMGNRKAVVDALQKAVYPQFYDEHHGFYDIMNLTDGYFYLSDGELKPSDGLIDYMLGNPLKEYYSLEDAYDDRYALEDTGDYDIEPDFDTKVTWAIMDAFGEDNIREVRNFLKDKDIWDYLEQDGDEYVFGDLAVEEIEEALGM